MQAQSTTATLPQGDGEWVWSHGDRKCSICGDTIPTRESHLAWRVPGRLIFLTHVCNGCVVPHMPNCPACGKPTEEGTCWNLYCEDGFANMQAEVGVQPSAAEYLAMDR